MIRAQILLKPWQHQFLEALAQKQRKSVSQLVREWVEEKAREQMADRGNDPLWNLVGIVQDAPPDMAENHDEYLYGAYGDKIEDKSSPRKRRR